MNNLIIIYHQLPIERQKSQKNIRIEVTQAHSIVFVCLKTDLLEELLTILVNTFTDHVDYLKAGSPSHTPMLLILGVVSFDLIDFLLCHLLYSAILVAFQFSFSLFVANL